MKQWQKDTLKAMVVPIAVGIPAWYIESRMKKGMQKKAVREVLIEEGLVKRPQRPSVLKVIKAWDRKLVRAKQRRKRR